MDSSITPEPVRNTYLFRNSYPYTFGSILLASFFKVSLNSSILDRICKRFGAILTVFMGNLQLTHSFAVITKTHLPQIYTIYLLKERRIEVLLSIFLIFVKRNTENYAWKFGQ
jgi:hypothetical protein